MNFMETKIRKIDKNQIDQEIIEEAGALLKEGKLVAFPTETVYGLGADALQEEAPGKRMRQKGDPRTILLLCILQIMKISKK